MPETNGNQICSRNADVSHSSAAALTQKTGDETSCPDKARQDSFWQDALAAQSLLLWIATNLAAM